MWIQKYIKIEHNPNMLRRDGIKKGNWPCLCCTCIPGIKMGHINGDQISLSFC